MKLFFYITAFFIFLNSYNAEAQIVKYANDYLSTAVFSRGVSMGGADFMLFSGSQSVFNNPSGLAFEDYKMDFSLMHSDYFSSLASLQLFSAAFRADTSTFLGFGAVRFAVDDIQNTIYLFDNGNMDYSRISYFSVADYAFFFDVSRKLKFFPEISLGASMKLIYRHQGKFADAYGFGFDIGATYSHKKFSASMVLKDVTTTFDFWSVNKNEFDSVYLSTGNSVPENSLEITPVTLDLGASYYWNLYSFKFLCAFAVKTFFDSDTYYLIHSKHFSADLRLGSQISYSDMIFLRFGFSDFQKNNNLIISKKFSMRPSFGLGVKFFRFGFDYTFFSDNSIERNSNIFTLNVKF